MIFYVGAHLGEFHIMVRNLGFKGSIFSYEPQIDIFQSLSKNIYIQILFLIIMQLVTEFQKKLFIYKNIQTSSLESSLTKKHTGSYFANTITLDNILKIDVQGHEFELLKNSNLLKKYVDFIQIELGIKKLYRYETLCHEIFNIFTKKSL